MLTIGCFEKETPIAPFPRGDVQEQTIGMGRKYENQLFFNLAQNEVVKSIDRGLWDVAFNCSANNQTIYLNTGKSVFAAVTQATELAEISDTTGLKFMWDWSNGKDDSTALSGWQNHTFVWIINLGKDLKNKDLGFVKVKFKLVNQELNIEYAELNSTEIKTATLTKNGNFNRTYFSFISHEIVDVEPPKETFDLIFRQYTYYFEAEELPYLVVGALTNPYNTKVSIIKGVDFENITLSDTLEHPFSDAQDAIGYDWKWYDFGNSVYVVNPKKCFILQSSSGYFYKAHFVDFYSIDGDAGYPKIEFKQL